MHEHDHHASGPTATRSPAISSTLETAGAELGIQPTDLAVETERWARRIQGPALANHSARSYLFAQAVADQRDMRPGIDFDDEVVMVSCLLHDVGLVPAGDGDQRFELDGADAAVAFLHEHGLNEERAAIVWEAIALHSSLGIAHRLRPEVALTHLGVTVDVAGDHVGLDPDVGAAAHAHFPRLGIDRRLHDAVVDQARANPRKAPPFTFPGELMRAAAPGADATTVVVPTWAQVVAGNGWPKDESTAHGG